MDFPHNKLSEIDILNITEKKILLKNKNNIKLINRNENDDKDFLSNKRNLIEENLKLKGLERLEKNVLRNKSLSKLNKMINANTNNINNTNRNIKVYCNQNSHNNFNNNSNNYEETQKEKTIVKIINNKSIKISKKILDEDIYDNPEFRKTIKNEKIEINCLDIGYNKSKSGKDINPILNTSHNSINNFPLSQSDHNDNEELQYFDLNNLIEEYNETYKFLKSINLHEKYFFAFINDGWDDLNSIILIEQAHLDLMNIEESDKELILNQVNITKKDMNNSNNNNNNISKGKINSKGVEIIKEKEQKEQKNQRLLYQKALNEFRSTKKLEHESIILVIIIFILNINKILMSRRKKNLIILKKEK